MKKGWRIILAIVLSAVLLGVVAVAVGFMTGADMTRIYSVLDARYHIDMYYQYALEVMGQLYAVF